MSHSDSTTFDRDEFVKAWHEYGLRFSVFVPDHQPKPDTWEPDVSESYQKDRTNPHYLKHWKFLARTKGFLRERYAKYNVLEGPTLFFDCLVRKYQNPMRYVQVEQESGPDFFPVDDRKAWYEKAIRMGIWDWQVGLSCRSILCQRSWCLMHRGNPHRINPVDIYGLLTVFERIPAVTAKDQVGKWFGMKLGDLESSGKKKSVTLRRKVSKQTVYELLKKYGNMRSHQVKELIGHLHALVIGSELVEWHRRQFDDNYAFLSDKTADNLYRINGPAVKAYVWLLIRQEEVARNTRGPKFNVSDAELAQGLGVTKRTACNYREQLGKLGFVEISVENRRKSSVIQITKVKY